MMSSIPIVHTKPSRRIFLDPGDYHTCHLQVPDIDERLPGISFANKLYSFFKVVVDREKALDVMERIFDNGDDAVITQTRKGFVLWVLEPNASMVKKKVRTVLV
jgi:hypothetical protein